MKLTKRILLALALVMGLSVAQAEQFEALGEWDVHYIVVNSTFFQPDIVRAYGLQRSRYNAIVNISVLKTEGQKAQSVAISGTATNLLGTQKKLKFKQIEEGDAIYYVAQLSFRDREKYRFDIDIQQGNHSQSLNFQQELFVD